MIVWQNVVPALVRTPPQAEECRSALVRLALRKSTLVRVEEERSAPHRLALRKIAFLRFDEEKSTPARF
jgi:hypothetical protein